MAATDRLPGIVTLMTGASEASLQASVRGYVADAMRCSTDGVVEVSRFDRGNRHAVFKVVYRDASRDECDVVVRAAYGIDPDELRQAEREATVLGVVGGVAAPAIYDFRPSSPWFKGPVMCLQFVPGEQRDLARAGPADLERLGCALRSVHHRPTRDLAGCLPTDATMASYAEVRLHSILAGIQWVRDPLPVSVQARLRATAAALDGDFGASARTTSFTTPAPLALLHGDPAADNILWTPDPVLIDWEYARLGDPADEIAYLFDQNELGPMQRAAFMNGYQDNSSEITERVKWWEPVTLLGSTLWWVERWVRRTDADARGLADAQTPQDPAYYLDQIIRRMQRLEGLSAVKHS
jgi:aminoglycoside phosphotransferase (APT) family kinase protein